MKTKKEGYVGQVQDRLTDGDRAVLYRSQVCSTYEEAHQRASKAAKRSGYGERAQIIVVHTND